MASTSAAGAARIVKLDSAQPLSKAGAPKNGKKAKSGNKHDKKRKAGEASSGDESGSDVDFVNVDLDFFGFIDSDYLAIKNLLTQLFSHDAKDLDIAGLADHLIEQEEEVGTGIKSDGEESDPLAFIGVLPWQGDKACLASLRTYLLSKTTSSPSLNALLQDSNNKIGIVVSERLVNMPVQVVPPLLRIFDQELDTTGGNFAFTHLLFLSKTFLASADDFPEDVDMDAPASAPTKKKKKKSQNKVGALSTPAGAAAAPSESFLYHLEDELIAKHAGQGMWLEYGFSNAPVRGQMGVGEDFGVDMRGRMALLERPRLKDVVAEAETLFSA